MANSAFSVTGTGSGSGSLILLQSTTVSSQNSVAFTDLPSSTLYSKLQLVGTNLVASSSDSIVIQFSSNNGSSYISSNYYYGLKGVECNTAGASGPSNGAGSAGVVSTIGANVGSGAFTMDLYGINVGAGGNIMYYTDNIYYIGNTGYPFATDGGGVLIGTNVVNAFQLFLPTYQFTSGNFYLYGLLV